MADYEKKTMNQSIDIKYMCASRSVAVCKQSKEDKYV